MESIIFFSLPEITENVTIYLSLKARVLGLSKRILRNRLENNKYFPELKFISRQSYLSIKGQVTFLFKEEEIILRRTPKYSGWSRHHNDKGSLGIRRDITISDVVDPFVDVNLERILRYLTVGEITLFGDVVFHPDEDQKVRNGFNPKVSQK